MKDSGFGEERGRDVIATKQDRVHDGHEVRGADEPAREGGRRPVEGLDDDGVVERQVKTDAEHYA